MTRLSLLYAVILILCIGWFNPIQTRAASITEHSSIENAGNEPMLTSVSGGLKFVVTTNSEELFHIYSITGQLIQTITLSSGEETVGLPQGYYIVRCRHWSRKVIVR